jgi:hypothetical protein
MKKLLTLLLCAAGSCAMAQMVQQNQPAPAKFQHQVPGVLRLNVYTTYAFDDKVDSYYSTTSYFEGTLKGGFEYGGGLEYILRPAYGLELSYLRLDSKAPLTYYDNGVKSAEFKVASNYLMLGGNRYLLVSPKLEPYFGVQFGMGIFNVENPDNGKSGNATKFAWGIKAGANIWLSNKIGLKLQGGLLSAVQSVGGGLYFGTGGAGAGVSGYSTFYQWSLGGGLIFDINGGKK